MNGTNISQTMFALVVIIGLPGVLALVGALVGYGKLQQRLAAVEKDVEKLSQLRDSVVRIEERTFSQGNDMTEIKESLLRISDHILDGALDLIRQQPRHHP